MVAEILKLLEREVLVVGGPERLRVLSLRQPGVTLGISDLPHVALIQPGARLRDHFLDLVF